MLFYKCQVPSASVMDIEDVKNVVMERYNCYESEAREWDITNAFDEIGHFFMCLIASKSRALREFIVQGEVRFCMEKLKNYKIPQIKSEISQAVKFLKLLNQIEELPFMNDKYRKEKDLVERILSTIYSRVDHVFSINHHRHCCKSQMILPFTFLLKMVANREVEISDGKVTVSCSQWKGVLERIFEFMLEFEINYFDQLTSLQSLIYEREDDRLRRIIQDCLKNISGQKLIKLRDIKSNDIDKESRYFPPCMASLHQILRQTHRLSYESRYQYTLFLKDIGLPVAENIAFWRNEYTKPHQSSNCCHYWEKKASRYEYQIKHLYGMIGCNSERRSHPCQRFTEKLSPRMNGGCPFVHLSEGDLLKSFPHALSHADAEDILKLKNSNSPQVACARYLQCVHAAIPKSQGAIMRNEQAQRIMSPLQYYCLARGVRWGR